MTDVSQQSGRAHRSRAVVIAGIALLALAGLGQALLQTDRANLRRSLAGDRSVNPHAQSMAIIDRFLDRRLPQTGNIYYQFSALGDDPTDGAFIMTLISRTTMRVHPRRVRVTHDPTVAVLVTQDILTANAPPPVETLRDWGVSHIIRFSAGDQGRRVEVVPVEAP